MDKKKIVPAFAPFFKANGYKRKGHLFIKIENDIAFCVSFQRPTAFVYVHYFIWPLCMPTEVRYLTYGDRLESHSIYPVPSYNTLAEDNDFLIKMRKLQNSLPNNVSWSEPARMDFQEWMLQVQQCLTEDIFPFFDSINSPEKLLNFMRKDVSEIKKYFPLACAKYSDRSKLCAYVCLLMSDLKKAAEYLALTRMDLLENADSSSPEVLKMWLDELSVLEQMINAPQETRETFIRDTIAHTLETCFRIRPQETKGS